MIPNLGTSRRKAFDAICPPLYQETEIDKLPPQSRALYPSLIEWKPNPKGMLLTGPSRLGKTRLMWLVIKHIMLEYGVVVKYFDGLAWQIAVTNAFANTDTTNQFIHTLSVVECVYIDDLFKGSTTETQERALFALFERRSQMKKPIFATFNCTGAELRARMSNNGSLDIFEPLMKRMGEFCDIHTLVTE